MRVPLITGPQYQSIRPRKGGGGGGQTTIAIASTTPRTTQTTSKGSSRSLGSSSRGMSGSLKPLLLSEIKGTLQAFRR